MQVALRAQLLKTAFATIGAVVDQGRLRCYADRLEFGEIDSAHVCFVELRIEAAACARFRVARDLELGLSVAALSKVLHFAQGHELVELSYAPNKDCLGVRVESGQRELDFEIRLLQISADQISFDQTYESWAVLPAAEFRGTCKALADLHLCDTVSLEVLGAPAPALTFRLPDRLGRRTYALGAGGALQEVHTAHACSASVALSKLQLLHCDSDQSVTIAVDAQLPLRLSVGSAGCTLRLYVAPQEAAE